MSRACDRHGVPWPRIELREGTWGAHRAQRFTTLLPDDVIWTIVTEDPPKPARRAQHAALMVHLRERVRLP